jgi:hypothetical protein
MVHKIITTFAIFASFVHEVQDEIDRPHVEEVQYPGPGQEGIHR